MRYHKIALLIPVFIMLLCLGAGVAAQDVQKITKEELKAMLGNQDLVIIDLRREPQWASSDKKIKGAIREDPGSVGSWAGKHEKDKTYVLYCA